MNEVQKMLVSFHASLVLVSIMAGTLLFVFEVISVSQIVAATLLNTFVLELGFFFKGRFLSTNEKPQANAKADSHLSRTHR